MADPNDHTNIAFFVFIVQLIAPEALLDKDRFSSLFTQFHVRCFLQSYPFCGGATAYGRLLWLTT